MADTGSTDGSREIAEQYADVLVWNYYIASLPEEERREAVLRGIEAVAEIMG
jgi:glycosyltransferase involved in cell wall biosynthesis